MKGCVSKFRLLPRGTKVALVANLIVLPISMIETLH